MLGLILAATLSSAPSCQQRCSEDADRCYSTCKGSTSCSHHCDERVNDCSARCSAAKDKAKAEARKNEPAIPCDMKGKNGQLRPCSEAELKVFKEAMNSAEAKKALKCKNARGVPMPCKDDDKSDELVKAAGDEQLCKDANGNPTLCAEAAKRVEKTLK